MHRCDGGRQCSDPLRERMTLGNGAGQPMPLPAIDTLRRFDVRGWELWLVPVLAAAAGATLLASAGPDVALLRGLVFVGGPVLLLAGLHSRLDGYLHATARLRLLPLPVPPRLHWRAAAAPHRRGLWVTGALGLVAVAAPTLAAGLPGSQALGLIADFVLLWTVALLLEPLIPAVGAWLGRRFDEDRAPRQWQLRLGGGWTIPEAVVHLYAPALGVGLVALLAMPGQLWLDRRVDGLTAPLALAITALVAVMIAALLGRLAARVYDQGMFGAVPWVHEATRTLAGPPIPEAVPRWLLVGHDPARHLLVRQFWRVTPVPGLRLFALLGGGTWIGLAAAPSVSAAAIVLALAAAWLVPGARVVALRPGRVRMCAALPLAAAARAGRSPSGWALLATPVVSTLIIVGIAWSTTS